MKTFKIASLAVAALLATPALAQSSGMQSMGGMDMSMMKPTPANPYPPAEMDMHKKMMSATGADATETWVRKLVEHHRGAIAMSRIVLRPARSASWTPGFARTASARNSPDPSRPGASG